MICQDQVYVLLKANRTKMIWCKASRTWNWLFSLFFLNAYAHVVFFGQLYRNKFWPQSDAECYTQIQICTVDITKITKANIQLASNRSVNAPNATATFDLKRVHIHTYVGKFQYARAADQTTHTVTSSIVWHFD